jgi:hypothetical protein
MSSHDSEGDQQMKSARWWVMGAVALIGFVLVPSAGRAQEKKADVKLPDAVKKTFDAKFPNGKILKIEAEEENGVMVYDIEFKDGAVEKETDITADGTMLEFTIVVDANAVPAPAMKPIQKAAEGATIKRLESIEISYETKGGKVIKLPKPVTHYAAELTRGGKTAEIVVGADGTVIEEAKWAEPKD